MQLAVDAFADAFVRFHQSCRERDAPGIQGIAELADHEQRPLARFAHDANGVYARRLAAGIRHKARAVCFQLLARCALVHVVGAVGQLVGEDVLVDPSLADLLDVLQLRNAAGCCCVHLPILCLAVVRAMIHQAQGEKKKARKGRILTGFHAGLIGRARRQSGKKERGRKIERGKTTRWRWSSSPQAWVAAAAWGRRSRACRSRSEP